MVVLEKTQAYLPKDQFTTEAIVHIKEYIGVKESKIGKFKAKEHEFLVVHPADKKEYVLTLWNQHINSMIDILGTGDTDKWIGKNIIIQAVDVKTASGGKALGWVILGVAK